MKFKSRTVSEMPLYPLRFEPIYQYRLWGGRRLANLLSAPLPGDGPIGEAWVLSDRTDHQSLVANGPLKGQTLGHMMERFREQLMGKSVLALHPLSAAAQVSGRTRNAFSASTSQRRAPRADSCRRQGKDRSVGCHRSRERKPYLCRPEIRHDFRQSAAVYRRWNHCEPTRGIAPKAGDAVFIPAGTVHTLGDDVVVFEVQQNSDVTFRLYDWGHVDAKTGQPRPLQVDQALASIDFAETMAAS